MFLGSIIVIATLVVFSPQDGLAQSNSSTVAPGNETNSTTAATPTATVALQLSVTAVALQTSTVAPQPNVTATQSSMTAGVSSASVTPVPSSQPSATAAPTKKTCGKLSVVIKKPEWNAAYTNKSSSEFKDLEKKIIDSIKSLFNDTDKYSNVDVSDLSIEEQEGNIQMSIKVCLIVKKAGGDDIQDVIIASVNSGTVKMLEVDKKSGAFEWIGVELSDWKAKDGECKKCSDGGAGPIVIEGTCKPKEEAYTCEYVKKTKETKECLTFCDSSVTTKISSLILAIGMLLSVSFNIWK